MMRSPIHQRLKIGPQSPARKRHTSQRLSERHIQETCSSFLELDGWRRLRTDPVSDHNRGKGFGELGMADDLYIRYRKPLARSIALALKNGEQAIAEVLWIEWKRAKGGNSIYTKAEKAKIHQQAWHAAERARGAYTLIAGEDFPASIEGFREFYRKSGLMRKEIN